MYDFLTITFWDMIPYILVYRDKRFGRTSCLHLQERKDILSTFINMATVGSFEISISVYQITRRHIPEHRNLQNVFPSVTVVY
jgi:hypothetical protein